MPRKHARIDGQPHQDYPNASGAWHGCPMTCPDSCPFEECNMPPEIAARLEPPHWHGWVMDNDGNIVAEVPKHKWSKKCYAARGLKHGRNEQEHRQGR